MSESFNSYPMLEHRHYTSMGYVADSIEFSYNENFEEYSLNLELSGDSAFSNCGKIKDPRCSWYPETHNLRIQKNCKIASAYCLFGEGGIAPSGSTIGIALRWISTKSDERGIVPFGEITRYDGSCMFRLDHNFDRGTLRGSLKLQTVFYLKNPGIPKSSEWYFANQSGIILGVLDQSEIYIDGNGSVFPIVVIENPGKPLWHVYYSETADVMEDKFDGDNVEIRLNKAHPNFEDLKIETTMAESPLFIEVLSAALMVIVQSVRESAGEDWDNILSGTGYETGSIAEAINYFVTKLQWDVSSPTKLSVSIKEFLEKGN